VGYVGIATLTHLAGVALFRILESALDLLDFAVIEVIGELVG
jgi:hypothetical protein